MSLRVLIQWIEETNTCDIGHRTGSMTYIFRWGKFTFCENWLFNIVLPTPTSNSFS